MISTPSFSIEAVNGGPEVDWSYKAIIRLGRYTLAEIDTGAHDEETALERAEEYLHRALVRALTTSP